MNKPRSKKHHYLPRYYLKGFTDDTGGFFVYDKRSGDIFSTSPDAAFFENDLNTVELPDGTTSDYLENLYTILETDYSWEYLHRIRHSTHNTPIELMDKMHLFLFVLFLHWRLPCNVDFIDTLADQFFRGANDLDYFRLKSKTGEAVPAEIVERLTSSSAFKKSAKMIVPFAPFFKDREWGHKVDAWRFIYTENQKSWLMVGDNPIVTRGLNDHDPVKCLDEFMFPVSGRVLLVAGSPLEGRSLPPDFIIQYNAAIIERSERFVACPRRDFLEDIIGYHAHGKTSDIVNELFAMLTRTDAQPL